MFPIIPFVDWTEQEKKQEQKKPKNFESKLYFITVAKNIMKYCNFFFHSVPSWEKNSYTVVALQPVLTDETCKIWIHLENHLLAFSFHLFLILEQQKKQDPQQKNLIYTVSLS